MRACIHRGAQQVGGSCVQLESQGQRLLIDFGLPLDAEEDRRQYLKDIEGLDGCDPSLLGVLVSHPHIDHYGLLSFISPDIQVGMGAAAKRILRAAAPFMRNAWSPSEMGWDFRSGESFDIGPFQVTPFLMDHSAYDSYSLLIESDGTGLFYSGDFRSHGRKSYRLEQLCAKPPTNVSTLLLEGTSIGRCGSAGGPETEVELESRLVEEFQSTEGLVLVQASAQNIDRTVSIYKATRKAGRTLLIDLYTAAVLEATGNENIPQSSWVGVALLVPQSQRVQIKENKWFPLLKQHSRSRTYLDAVSRNPKDFTLLFRPLYMQELERNMCLSGAHFIYSLWEGYWGRSSNKKLRSWLKKHSIEKMSIHTSGHAGPGDLQRLAAALNPEKIVPIHSFASDRYSEYFEKVEVHDDGNWWTV